ncbi:MAG: helicase-associated domain-containing protein [Verrucomicrobiae bacterium]|nr:helicase-associated domain-containing protein [Verrucomicrobiae bacterium]
MKTVKLDSVLAESGTYAPNVDRMNAEDMKVAARVWVGGKGVASLRKAEVEKRLKHALKSRGAGVVEELDEIERDVLASVARHGGAVSQLVVSLEAYARGYSDAAKSSWNRRDFLSYLRARLLVQRGGSDWERTLGQAVVLAPRLRRHLPASEPLALSEKDILQPGKVRSDGYRSAAEVMIELLDVHEFLSGSVSWKPLKGGGIPKAVQNRLAKRRSAGADDSTAEMSVPDVDAFHYEMLRGLHLVEGDDLEHRARKDVSKITSMSSEEFLWNCVRAWMGIRLWQDGIGAIKARRDQYNPDGIEFGEAEASRILLSWALARLAHSAIDWVDLESFLLELHTHAKKVISKIYYSHYVWNPDFKAAKDRTSRDYSEVGNARREIGYWLAGYGGSMANALLVTLHALGLVERGKSGANHCFRLTAPGRLVFGAPEIRDDRPDATSPFLVVQPNFDVIAHVRGVEPAALAAVTPFLKRVSKASGEALEFRLDRESVYRALEAGLTCDEIRSRLEKSALETIPAVVERALTDWSGKRESLVLRKNVCLIMHQKKEDGNNVAGTSYVRAISDTCSAAPGSKAAAVKRAFSGHTVVDHRSPGGGQWEIDEDGTIANPDTAGMIEAHRLATIARQSRGQWAITPESVRAAVSIGIPAAQIIHWVKSHAAHRKIPALLATAIQNWARTKKCFSGTLAAVQISDPDSYRAICHSKAFEAMIAGIIAPDWIVFHSDKATAANKLLRSFGFSIDGVARFEATESIEKPIEIVLLDIATAKTGAKKSAKLRKDPISKPRKISVEALARIREAQRVRWSKIKKK